MATSTQDGERSGGGGRVFLWAIVFILLFLGGALSGAAYVFSEQELTAVESIGAGFGGLAGLIIGIFGAIASVIIGLVGAVIGIVVAGGALAFTLFLVGSPIIAIILFLLLMRSRKTSCPDPDAHRHS